MKEGGGFNENWINIKNLSVQPRMGTLHKRTLEYHLIIMCYNAIKNRSNWILKYHLAIIHNNALKYNQK
jgi:hypothetical protein